MTEGDKIISVDASGNRVEITKSDIAAACRVAEIGSVQLWQIAPIEELGDVKGFYGGDNPDDDVFVYVQASRADFENIDPDFIEVPILGDMMFDSEFASDEEKPRSEEMFVRISEIGEIYRPNGKEFTQTCVRMNGTLVDFETPLSPAELLKHVPPIYQYHVLEAIKRGDEIQNSEDFRFDEPAPGAGNN